MQLSPRPRFQWQLRSRQLVLGERTLLMGIVNVTPDSFFDGSRLLSGSGPGPAVEHSLRLLAEGADLLDIGAESTRPGATPVSTEEEQARLLPVLEVLRREQPRAVLSVDTYHAATAAAALAVGADIINDVSGLSWDPAMAGTLAAHQPPPGVVLMHTRGRPTDWEDLPPLAPESVAPLVRSDLEQQLAIAVDKGIPPSNIVLDPGFGFGKLGRAENMSLLHDLPALHSLGRPLLVGLSRKGFLRAVSGRTGSTSSTPDPSGAQSEARLHATLAANTAAILAGAHILRVHDVAAAREAAAVADALLARAASN